MATPSELLLEEIRNYLLENGGTARRDDLVKHFKRFLPDPETEVKAWNRFREYINILATIKIEEGVQYLVLKKKYWQPFLDLSPPKQVGSPVATPDLATPVSPLREPPPYRPPPPAPLSQSSSSSHASLEESASPISAREKNDDSEPVGVASVSSPPVPPRRKSHYKLKVENKENVDRNRNSASEAVIKEDEAVTTTNPSSAEQLSVRERMQRFNRMASETDLHARPNETTVPTRKRADKEPMSSLIHWKKRRRMYGERLPPPPPPQTQGQQSSHPLPTHGGNHKVSAGQQMQLTGDLKPVVSVAAQQGMYFDQQQPQNQAGPSANQPDTSQSQTINFTQQSLRQRAAAAAVGGVPKPGAAGPGTRGHPQQVPPGQVDQHQHAKLLQQQQQLMRAQQVMQQQQHMAGGMGSVRPPPPEYKAAVQAQKMHASIGMGQQARFANAGPMRRVTQQPMPPSGSPLHPHQQYGGGSPGVRSLPPPQQHTQPPPPAATTDPSVAPYFTLEFLENLPPGDTSNFSAQ